MSEAVSGANQPKALHFIKYDVSQKTPTGPRVEKVRVVPDLWSYRPAQVIERINQNFQRISQTPIFHPDMGYVNTGEEGRGNYTYGSLNVESDALIRDRLKEIHGVASILELGSGQGDFLRATARTFEGRVTIEGVSAQIDPDSAPLPKGIQNRVINAEHLITAQSNTREQLFPPNSKDVIISKQTVKHFVDPLGDIAQAYKILKKSGLYIADNFTFSGIESQIPALITFLNSQGYAIAAEYDYAIVGNEIQTTGIKSFIMRKTQDDLNLPVMYTGLANAKGSILKRAHYELTADLNQEKTVLPLEMQGFISRMRKLNPHIDQDGVYADRFFSSHLQFTPHQIMSLWERRIQEEKERSAPDESIQFMEEMKTFLPYALDAWHQFTQLKTDEFRSTLRESLNLAVA